MKKGQKIKVKSTDQIGTIIGIYEDMVLVYIYKYGSFIYSTSNIEPIDRVPVSDCIENSQ
jgi:hypothetical protein